MELDLAIPRKKARLALPASVVDIPAYYTSARKFKKGVAPSASYLASQARKAVAAEIFSRLSAGGWKPPEEFSYQRGKKTKTWLKPTSRSLIATAFPDTYDILGKPRNKYYRGMTKKGKIYYERDRPIAGGFKIRRRAYNPFGNISSYVKGVGAIPSNLYTDLKTGDEETVARIFGRLREEAAERGDRNYEKRIALQRQLLPNAVYRQVLHPRYRDAWKTTRANWMAQRKAERLARPSKGLTLARRKLETWTPAGRASRVFIGPNSGARFGGRVPPWIVTSLDNEKTRYIKQ